MWVDDEGGKGIIVVFINLIFHDSEKVKPGKDWCSEVDVVVEVQGGIVCSLQRICCGDDAASSLQTGVDSCLGDRDGLLLHGFVDGGSVFVVHLVELIDEADTLVC